MHYVKNELRVMENLFLSRKIEVWMDNFEVFHIWIYHAKENLLTELDGIFLLKIVYYFDTLQYQRIVSINWVLSLKIFAVCEHYISDIDIKSLHKNDRC